MPGPEVIKPYSVLMLNSVLRLRSHAQLRMRAHGGYKTSWVRTQLSTPPWAYAQRRDLVWRDDPVLFKYAAARRNSLVDEDNKLATIYKQYQLPTINRWWTKTFAVVTCGYIWWKTKGISTEYLLHGHGTYFAVNNVNGTAIIHTIKRLNST